MLTETHTSVHDAGDSGQVGREVPWIRENVCKMCCHGLIELVRVLSMLTETLTTVHFAGDSGPVEREVQREFRQGVVLSLTDKELR